MKAISYIFCSVILLVLSAIATAGQTVSKSAVDDQVAIQITVYNSNLGLIKDTRKIALPLGEGELRFMDVASHIMPVTVHAKSLNCPDDFSVLEQNYEYDLINADKLLDKYVGKKTKLLPRLPFCPGIHSNPLTLSFFQHTYQGACRHS